APREINHGGMVERAAVIESDPAGRRCPLRQPFDERRKWHKKRLGWCLAPTAKVPRAIDPLATQPQPLGEPSHVLVRQQPVNVSIRHFRRIGTRRWKALNPLPVG